MNPDRKGRPKGPLVSGLIKTFENELNSFVRELSRNNYYAAFLYEQFLRDLKKLAKKTDPGINSANLISHCLPINSEFKFLPLQLYQGDPAYDLEMDMDSLWLKEGTAQDSLDVKREEYYSKKKSRIIKKIFDLSKGFSRCVEEIYKKSGIPVHSLTQIFSVITSEEKLVPLFQDGFQKGWVSIPSHIPVEQRDRVLSSISRKIYNLLVECFFVSIVSGMEDSLIAHTYLGENDFQRAKEYLLNMACYFLVEERIRSAASLDDLKEYFKEVLSRFLSFIKPFHSFFEKYAQPLVKRGVLLREMPFKVRRDPSSVRGRTKYLDYSYVESKREIPEEDSEGLEEEDLSVDYVDESEHTESEHTEDDEENLELVETEDSEYKALHYLLKERPRDFGDSYPSPKTGGKKEEDWDIFKHEKEGFFYEILSNMMGKWRRGLMSKYKLRGNPLGVISFIEGIFNKAAQSIIDEDYGERLKRTEGIGLRTKRRYEGEKKEGKIDKDLSAEEIRVKKGETKRHHVEGYWTLNQLIKELVNRGQGTRTTLMRKINKLLEFNRIQVSKEGGIYRFEASEETLDKIIEQISKL